MTSQKKSLDVNGYLSKFEETLFEIEYEHKDLSERQKLIRVHLDRVVTKADAMIEKKNDVRAVEYFFLCLGMLKKIVENQILKSSDVNLKLKGKELLQELFTAYDLPCSLKMCSILFEAGNYDQVFYLSERILAIDSQNLVAKEYIKSIKEAEQNEEFRRLKDAKDLNSYVYEYSMIQEEREKKRQEMHKKHNKEDEQYGKNDPAKSVLYGCEIFIKLLLVIPFILYKRICEPIFSIIYQGILLPLYLNIIVHIPILAPFVKIMAQGIEKTSQALIIRLEKWSGQEKQTNQGQVFEGIPLTVDSDEGTESPSTHSSTNGRRSSAKRSVA